MCSVINVILQITRRRNCKSARRRGVPRATGAVAIHIFLEASFHRPAVVDQKRSGTTRSLISHQKGMKMSGIVLSASVRQNLLSLQSTAELLSTTQSRLATGNKVNSALDNPTNFFTSQQKLVDTAKSIANQVLQAPTGYSAKASATSLAPTAGTEGTAVDLTKAGTNSLQAKTFIFTPATGAATTITISNVVAAGNVNSIDAFNAALTSAGLGLSASLASDGSITLTSTNENASQSLTIGATAAANTIAISGTDTATLVTPTGGAAGKPRADT